MTLKQLAQKGLAEEIMKKEWPLEELNRQDAQGKTILMYAAMQGDYRVVQALRAKGADITLQDENGRKAVDLAALYGHGTVIMYLIDGGCGG